MTALRLGCIALAVLWPLAASAQLVNRDVQGPALPNPADQVKARGGVRSCNNTIADVGARAVIRAIDSCPAQVYGSRQAYLVYAKQAVLGLTIPGAQAAAGAMAAEKLAENAFFCITNAIVDESEANDSDKAYVKALIAEAKENVDRVDLAKKLLDLRQGIIDKGIAPYLNEGEANTFVQTLDATLPERYQGTFGSVDDDGNRVPGTEVALLDAAAARNDSPQARANAATEQARALGRECRFVEADAALAQAQQLNLAYLADLREDVARAKHLHYCIATHDQRQQREPLATSSPFLRHSLNRAQAEIDEALRRDAELARFIGQIDQLHQSIRARRNDVEALKQLAAGHIATAREATSQCDFARAASALDVLNSETLECAAQLDAERRTRDELATLAGQLQQQLGQMQVEYSKIIAVPFSDVSSCGEFSLVADNFDQVQGQCREIANVESMVAALRNRARVCGEFKASELVQGQGAAPAAGALVGQVTVTPAKYEDFGERGYFRTTYEPASSTYERVDLAEQKQATIVWNYNGLPESLSAGQAVTITVTGGFVSEVPPGAGSGLTFAGSVAVYGDVVLKFAQQADRAHAEGRYEFIVNDNPQNIEIHFGGAPAGTTAIWKFSR